MIHSLSINFMRLSIARRLRGLARCDLREANTKDDGMQDVVRGS